MKIAKRILALLIIGALLIPAVHAQGNDIDYTPRIGKTLSYEGYWIIIGYNETGTYNLTALLSLNISINGYLEVGDDAYWVISYSGIVKGYINGTFFGTEPIRDIVNGSNPAMIGVFDEDLIMFLAINVTRIPEALYAYTLYLGPQNFTATLGGDNGNETLTVNAYLRDNDDIKYGELHVTYLLRYGIMLSEDAYIVPEYDEDTISPMDMGLEISSVTIHYELTGFSMTPIPSVLTVPNSRIGLKAKREITNGTETAYAQLEIEKAVVIGELILLQTQISITSPTFLGVTRTSTFGYKPTQDDPWAMPPVLVYPEYLDSAAQEYNATTDNYTVNGKTYTVYVFHSEGVEIAFIKDLGILAYGKAENGSIKLTDLYVPNSEEGGGEEGTSEGGIGGLSTQSIMVIALAIAILVLAILAYLLRRG